MRTYGRDGVADPDTMRSRERAVAPVAVTYRESVPLPDTTGARHTPRRRERAALSRQTVRGAFGNVMRPGTAPALATGTPPYQPSPPARPVTDYLAEFVDVCTAAIEVAFGRTLERCNVAPGVAVPTPLPMLLAYLLYLASTAPADEDPDRFADWFGHVERATWRRLGFTDAPARLEVELAFTLLRERAHQAPELHGLIALVEFLAGAGLIYGLRS